MRHHSYHHTKGPNTTVTAGLRVSGITAPWLLDGAMNGQACRTYVADVLELLPTAASRSGFPDET